jgi:hypothetical protein
MCIGGLIRLSDGTESGEIEYLDEGIAWLETLTMDQITNDDYMRILNEMAKDIPAKAECFLLEVLLRKVRDRRMQTKGISLN